MRGLSSEEARERLRRDGPNEIAQARPTSRLKLLAAQFESALIWLLLGACVIAVLLGEVSDAIAIAAIVVVNALVGFFQELRAEHSLLALRAMTAPRARVLRDTRAAIVPASEVVVGDVLLLEAGDIVAADAVLREAHSLTTNEAPLTGESLPVEKTTTPSPHDAPLAERCDHVFLGTSVARGTGTADVVATGMRTELGRIAGLLATAEERATPLQRRLAVVARTLLFACLGVVAVIAILGLLRGEPWLEVLLTSVSLAVAAVPEGLPAVVTIALALGVQRLAAKHVLVRRLPSVETLGCVTTVCTDKTGTLTTGVMAVREVWGHDHSAILFAAAACSDAELSSDRRDGVGDPTEVALLREAAEHGIFREEIERENPRITVTPFDSALKYMAVSRADGVLYVKGAVEVVLSRCSSGAQGATEANAEMAQRGLRVLAVATGQGTKVEQLHLVGLVGIADPPRADAIAAIGQARGAGIRTVMITGDHPVTALAIARELGLVQPGDITPDLVHARATAEDKIRIVRELKRQGEIVAMTGDGVNDAPALREADIGIAMGVGGTEVTRQAADMVLTDDNYASIVAAIQEGRGIYDNIRKTLVYLLTGNFGELLVMFGAGVLGLPLPLLPLQLLWINLVTDGPPALALVTDPPESDLLQRPPRPTDEPMLGGRQWMYIVLTGTIEAAVTLSGFVWALRARDVVEARNIAFSVLIFSELFRSFATRSEVKTLWESGPLTNTRLVAVVLVSAFAQTFVQRSAFAERIFRLGPVPWRDVLVTLGLGLVTVTVLELSKLLRRLAVRRDPEP